MRFFFRFTEIVGTKEYRKPEWVTHMEQMQEALKGNENIDIRNNKMRKILNNNDDYKFMSLKCFYKKTTKIQLPT